MRETNHFTNIYFCTAGAWIPDMYGQIVKDRNTPYYICLLRDRFCMDHVFLVGPKERAYIQQMINTFTPSDIVDDYCPDFFDEDEHIELKVTFDDQSVMTSGSLQDISKLFHYLNHIYERLYEKEYKNKIQIVRVEFGTYKTRVESHFSEAVLDKRKDVYLLNEWVERKNRLQVLTPPEIQTLLEKIIQIPDGDNKQEFISVTNYKGEKAYKSLDKEVLEQVEKIFAEAAGRDARPREHFL